MKTLTKNTKSLYIFEDDKHLDLAGSDIIVGSPVEFIVANLGAGASTLHTNVTPPPDWAGGKYFFDGTTWTLNPDWVDVDEVPEQP
jgi:hypothetical protein